MYEYTRVIVASERLKDSDHFQSFVFQVNKLFNSSLSILIVLQDYIHRNKLLIALKPLKRGEKLNDYPEEGS